MERINNSHIEGIQNEYRRINSKWLRMHFRLLLWLVAFTTAMETAMYFVLKRLGAISTSDHMYLVKYLLVPLLCNLTACGAAAGFMHSRLTLEKKICAVSLLTAAVAFFVYSFHSVFFALFLVFAIPPLLTTAYGDRKLTVITSTVCLVGKAVSDLFLQWDPQEIHVFSSQSTLVDFALSMVLLLLFYVVCFRLLTMEQEKNEASINLERERQRYQEEAVTDALTKVGNRQALRAAFQQMDASPETPYFLAMMDLDDFKKLNDTYGHSQGDRYLRAMGRVLRETATDRMQPFRFGGDEFCILFRDCEQEEALAACRDIQERFLQEDIHGICCPVSVSIGVAEHLPEERPVQLLDRADVALYRAKHAKGNVHMYTEE